MKLYTASSYVEIIKESLKLNEGIRGYQSRLSEAVQVHNSYISRVLGQQVHLTPDQAALLCQFWRLDADETDFFLTLVNFERAGSKELKGILRRQLERLRKKNEDLAERFKDAKNLETTEQGLYYSAWYFSAIHFLLLVPGHQRAAAIAAKLGLPLSLAESALETLRQLSLAREEKKEWSAIITNLHMSNMSHWSSIYHSNWRQRIAFKVHEKQPDDLHFTGLHVMSEKDFLRVKALLLDAIEEVRAIALPSPEEQLFCISVDWFRV